MRLAKVSTPVSLPVNAIYVNQRVGQNLLIIPDTDTRE
jgi:hypothetical protein